jgi:hypothetical protein
MLAPRKIGGNDYALIGLQHATPEKNTLCQLAFLCYRQFVGVSMLVKARCFSCHRRTAKKCSGCKCAFFCSTECQQTAWPGHKKLCKLVNAVDIEVLAESLEVEL